MQKANGGTLHVCNQHDQKPMNISSRPAANGTVLRSTVQPPLFLYDVTRIGWLVNGRLGFGRQGRDCELPRPFVYHTVTHIDNDGMAQLLLGGIGSSATRRLALAASSDWNKNRTHLEGDRDPSTPNPIG